MVIATAIGDEIADRADLEVMELGEGNEIVHPRHGAVVLHDLADHAGWIEPCQPGDIDRRLGMAGALQYAAITGDERNDKAGLHDFELGRAACRGRGWPAG